MRRIVFVISFAMLLTGCVRMDPIVVPSLTDPHQITRDTVVHIAVKTAENGWVETTLKLPKGSWVALPSVFTESDR